MRTFAGMHVYVCISLCVCVYGCAIRLYMTLVKHLPSRAEYKSLDKWIFHTIHQRNPSQGEWKKPFASHATRPCIHFACTQWRGWANHEVRHINLEKINVQVIEQEPPRHTNRPTGKFEGDFHIHRQPNNTRNGAAVQSISIAWRPNVLSVRAEYDRNAYNQRMCAQTYLCSSYVGRLWKLAFQCEQNELFFSYAV